MWKITCLYSVEGVEEEALMKFHRILLEMHHLSNYFSELEWSVANMYPHRFEPGTFRKGSYK